MKIFKNSAGFGKIKNPVLTLGNFDGLHLGHRKIIKKVAERAKELKTKSVVFTFDPHPLKVVAPHKSPPLILDSEEKAKLISEFGIDYLIFAKFTKEFASTHPRQFVENVLVKGLSVKEVWVGHDFSFGHGKAGNVDYLRHLGEELGFKVFVMPAFKKSGAIVSSSRIRELVKTGNVRGAATLLGRNFKIKGKVVRGKDIGKEIGFPTANLKVSSEIIPENGVYVAYASVAGKSHPAVLNIGTAPTFGGKERCVEVHILDFKNNIYGKKMEVSFVKRLRSEKTFKSKEALVTQIRKDTEKARQTLHV
ncbi:MAG: bifunctional riboflavin kinase/FAD synthetase [Deltaproteobacteria bacterium]|nr:bifunctional riboflavin kinase/FAD synthetase [Deltaproteobacteria bacterium]